MEEIIAGALGFLAIQTGRVVVWLVSFGQWRGEQLLGDEGRIHSAAGSLSFVHGRRVITDTGLLFFGIGFYAVLLVVIIAFFA